LPNYLKAQIGRELDRLELLLEQIKAVEAERDSLLASTEANKSALPAMLLDLKGIGPEFAAILWSEGLCRHFDNRRQVAAYAGLAPTPWQSGSVDREQGISKAGNPRLRETMIHLMVLRTGEAQCRSPQEENDCGLGPKATGRALEVCERRHCDRRGCDQNCLIHHSCRIFQSSRT
jgi:transposase